VLCDGPGMVLRRDFRKLEPATQAELRRVAVALVEAGKTRVEAAAAVGVNRRFVGEWVEAVRRSGEAALAGGRRGRRPGEQKPLTPQQERRIRRLITERCPDQLKLPFALWTRGAVGALIARETGVRPSASALGRILRAWGFTAQRPARRASERREPAVRTWLQCAYPVIAARAKAEGAEIHWADETGLSNQANYGRSFAPRGETPVLPRPARRVLQSMISSLTNRGTLRFMVYDGALSAATFLVFLRRLVSGADRKLFVIADNLRVHRARRVTAWVKANAERIELFYLPPYAPEHNPDEFLNNDVKQALARRQVPRDKTSLKAGLVSYMRGLQRRPAKVRAFFQAASVRYAA
jgi:transposase